MLADPVIVTSEDLKVKGFPATVMLIELDAVTNALFKVKGVAKISTLASAVIVTNPLAIVNGSLAIITLAASPETAGAPIDSVNKLPVTVILTEPSLGFDEAKGNSANVPFPNNI
jgi:hypothetical protein